MFSLTISTYDFHDHRTVIVAGAGRIRTCEPIPMTDRTGRVNFERKPFVYVAAHTVLSKHSTAKREGN